MCVLLPSLLVRRNCKFNRRYRFSPLSACYHIGYCWPLVVCSIAGTTDHFNKTGLLKVIPVWSGHTESLASASASCGFIFIGGSPLLASSATPTASPLGGSDLVVWLVDWGCTHTNKQSDHTHTHTCTHQQTVDCSFSPLLKLKLYPEIRCIKFV